MKLADLKNFFYINILSIVTNVFYILWIISLFTLLPFLIKIGGAFDPIQDIYPGMITYHAIVFWSLVIYLFIFINLIRLSLIERKYQNKDWIKNQALIKILNSNNIFYNFIFWLGIIEIFLPIVFVILYFIISISTEFLM